MAMRRSVITTAVITFLLTTLAANNVPAGGETRPTAGSRADQAEFFSGHPDFDATYRKATNDIASDIVDGKFIAGQDWAQLWTRDSSYSIDAGAGLVHPDVASATLRGMTQRDPLGEVWTQDSSGHFAGWPNLTDSIVGAIGAWSLYTTTGDQSFLQWSYQVTKNSLARAERDVFDPASGLFKGCSTFMESDSAYPIKYANNGALVGQTKALSTNLLYYRGYIIAGWMGKLLGQDVSSFQAKAEHLKDSINQRLWLPNKGYYAYYEDENGTLSDHMEGTGESFAILWDVADPTRSASILANAPTTAYGFPSQWPQYPEWLNYNVSDAYYYHNGMVWPFVQGYWAWAAASKRNAVIFDAELNKLLALSQEDTTFHEFYRPENGMPDGSPRQLWSASGYLSMVYHGLFGMNFGPGGVGFSPVVPSEFNALTLLGLHFRSMSLDIHVAGSGTTVSSFLVDGQPRCDDSVPADLTGSHDVTIVMAGDSNTGAMCPALG